MVLDRRRKLSLVFLALLFALGAIYLQSRSDQAVEGFRSEALFRNRVLGDQVLFEALQSKAGHADFQRLFNNSLSLERVPEEPKLLRASIITMTQQEAGPQMRLLKKELSRVSQELAASEIRTLAKNLDQIEKPSTRKPKPSNLAQRRKPTLSSTERQKALRLAMEREDLEKYLNGGPEPPWLGSRLEKDLSKRAEEELRESESELRNLKERFRSQSKSVKALEQEVARLRKVVRQNKLHLAKVLLKSHKQELTELDNKALSRIEENARLAKAATPSPETKGSSGSEEWFGKISDGLKADQAALESAAVFHLVSEIKTTQLSGGFYWWRLVLWLSAALFLLMALFRPESPTQPKATASAPASPISLTPSPGAPAPPKLEPEPLLTQLVSSVKGPDGNTAHRYLILGNSNSDARPVVTVRLAKTLSALGRNVRLVDFDLKNKLLSSKLGNFDTAGVADLLTSQRVPAEEFLAPLSGTTIEFAPAGNSATAPPERLPKESLLGLLTPRRDGTLVVDAGFDSPVEQILEHVEAVICVTSANNKWDDQQQKVLLQIRQAEKPIWGLIQGDKGLYPFG